MENSNFEVRHNGIRHFATDAALNSQPKQVVKIPTLHNKKRHMGTNARFTRLIAVCIIGAEIASAGIVSGCNGSGQQSSTSSVIESESSSDSLPSSQSPTASQTSSQSADGYVLPRESGTSSTSASESGGIEEQSIPATNSSTESIPQTAEQTSSQSIFQSVFDNNGMPESGQEKEDISGSKISMAEYDKLNEGMTYLAVKSIIGSDGQLQWDSGEKGSNTYAAQYRWEGTGTSESYANLTFRDGKLEMKIQFGLE